MSRVDFRESIIASFAELLDLKISGIAMAHHMAKQPVPPRQYRAKSSNCRRGVTSGIAEIID